MQDICFVTPKGVVTHRLRTTSVAHVFSLYFAKSTSWWACLKFFLTNYKKNHSILISFRSKLLISALTGDIMLGFKMTPFLQILIDLFFSEPIAEMAENCLHAVSLWELSQTLWKAYISLLSFRSGSFDVCRCGQHFVSCTSNLAGHFNYINVSFFLYTSLQIAFIISASFVRFLLHLAFSLERQRNTFLFSLTL